jgi:CheY-like chemotaxis protein
MANVAVIDDDLDLLALFRRLIDPFHEVRTYADAATALSGVKANKPDIVLLDISLGDADGVDGVGVLHRLRSEPGWERVPVIAVTSHSLRSERARYLAEGFTDFIAKPLSDHGMVMSVIETALRGESSPETDDDLDATAAPMTTIVGAGKR